LAGQKSASTPIPFHPGALKYFKEKNIKVNWGFIVENAV
jgi:TRAP-type uncharacterized transport system substrate-binding protein